MASVFQKCKTDEKNGNYPCVKNRCGHPWTVRYREPGGRGGRQREKSFDSRREAADYGIKVENDKRERAYLDPDLGKVLVRDYADDWLPRRAVKDTTRANYARFIELHLSPHLGGKTLASVTSRDIEAMCMALIEQGLSRRTVYHTLMAPLRSLFRSAVAEKRIPESPVALAVIPKIKTKRLDEKSLPDGKAVRAIADKIRPGWAISIWLMAGCGLRIGEVLAVRKSDFDSGVLRLRRQFVRVKRADGYRAELAPLKAREEGDWRDVPVPSSVWSAVERHVECHGVGHDGYLLHAHHGGEVLDSNYRTEFKAAVKKAGYGDEPWTAHTLRHFFASSAIAGGVSLLEVSRWLGHATIQITADIYGHLTPDAGGRLRSVMDQVLAGASVVGADGEDRAGSVLVRGTE
ncbi:tyrosine-type recombinase/integrase [Streptomyces sp. NPDC020802]|uniref:tyrosine-type recombinase/integrase n=1 Tax=Streptomyces sp. NPDC020802 TaxID=3365094 RepID=UPI0037949217